MKIVKLLIMLSPSASSAYSHLDPNILLSTLFSNTLCSSLRARDQFSHSYKTTCNILLLIFRYLDKSQDSSVSKVMPTDWATCVPFLVGADRLWGPFYSARLKGPKRAAGHSQSSSAEANNV